MRGPAVWCSYPFTVRTNSMSNVNLLFFFSSFLSPMLSSFFSSSRKLKLEIKKKVRCDGL